MTENEQTTPRRLFRINFRGHDYLGTGEEWHAKVVAPDVLSAVNHTLQALELDPADLLGVTVTQIAPETELRPGKVFEVARRSRAFGERGAWRDEPPERRAEGPRETPLL